MVRLYIVHVFTLKVIFISQSGRKSISLKLLSFCLKMKLLCEAKYDWNVFLSSPIKTCLISPSLMDPNWVSAWLMNWLHIETRVAIIKGISRGSEWLIPVVSNIPIVPLTYCDWAIVYLWSLMGMVPLVHPWLTCALKDDADHYPTGPWVNDWLWPIQDTFIVRIVHVAL